MNRMRLLTFLEKEQCAPSLRTALLDAYDAHQSQQTIQTVTDLESAHTLRPTEADKPQDWAINRAPSANLYEDLRELGSGGMGSVRLVYDTRLSRNLAMKIIHPKLLEYATSTHRFIEEAKICAQLQHPNIVPVHELGVLPDGCLYFTMKEIKGQSLDILIDAVHETAQNGPFRQTSSGWTFRKLIDAFYQVCQAMAYAHTNGILHRDLKPGNIMLGEFGEVLIVDWGIAKVLGQVDVDTVESMTSSPIANITQQGHVMGTPAYMSPEQARGEIDKLDARSDIYSLGAILYEILSGRSPYSGASSLDVLRQVVAAPPPPVGLSSLKTLDALGTESFSQNQRLPEELVEACEQAMARSPFERFQSAGELAKVISDWLDGAKRHEKALAIVDEAARLSHQCTQLRLDIKTILREAEVGLQDIPSWGHEDLKAEWWEKERLAQTYQDELRRLTVAQEQLLHTALNHKNDLEEAHLALIERTRRDHEKASKNRDLLESERLSARLRYHSNALPTNHPVRTKQLLYLKGTGSVSVRIDPSSAEVSLEQYVPYRRRLVPQKVLELGVVSHVSMPLEKGSYCLRIAKKGHHEVIYPLSIEGGEQWTSTDPRGEERPIRLLKKGTLNEGERFVPAGWFWAGGDEKAEQSLSPRRVWLDDFIIAAFPITNRQYLVFLNDLVRSGRHEDALRWAPRERGGKEGERGALIYTQTQDGFFRAGLDVDGLYWNLDWPVCMIDWYSAEAYAAWFAEKTGQSWQLVDELAWEKAARGVDGRWFPWGDAFDASYCCMVASHKDEPSLHTSHEFPVDCSVYGVQSLAGNILEWTASQHRTDWNAEPDENRVCRGGNRSNTQDFCRLATRIHGPPTFRLDRLGFRIFRYI